MSDKAIVLTGDQIEHARWMAIRSALGLEIRTGMRNSHGSVRDLANQITGKDHRTKRAAYNSLNKLITDTLGPAFDRPLEVK